MKKPSKLLKDVSFDFEPNETSLGPHIALTFDFQGGAASGYNKPLLFKADNLEITPELISKLKDLGVDTSEINKALSYENKRSLLISAIENKEFVDRWDWWYICDYTDDTIIFWVEDEGMFSVGYTESGVNFVVDDVAVPVVAISEYQVIDGDVLISEDAKKDMQQDMQDRLLKASNVDKVKEKILKYVSNSSQEDKNSVIKSEENKSEGNTSEVIIKDNGEPIVDLKEIMKSPEMADLLNKAVAEAVASKEAEKTELQKALDAEKARVDALEKAEVARVEQAYTSVVKSFSFVEEAKVEALVKALMGNPVDAVMIIEVLEKAKSEVEAVKAEFAKEKGVDTTTTVDQDANAIIKAKAEAMLANKTK